MKYVVLGTINPKWAEDPEGRIAAVHEKLDQLGITVESIYTKGP